MVVEMVEYRTGTGIHTGGEKTVHTLGTRTYLMLESPHVTRLHMYRNEWKQKRKLNNVHYRPSPQKRAD